MSKSKYYQRTDGLFETSRTINGKRKVFRGKTCKEIDRKIVEYQEEKGKGRYFKDVAEEWYKLKESELSVGAQKMYACKLNRIVDEFPQRITGIKPIDIKRCINKIEREGYAGQTVQQYLSIIKQICSHAVLCGDIDISPATEISKSKGLPKKVRTALTEEQEQKVIACRNGDFWLFGYMLLYTGCRRGELLALTYQDIDRKNKIIHINKKLNYSVTPAVVEPFLKSANGKRDIPLLAPLEDVLPKNRIGLIFPGANGQPMIISEYTKKWYTYCGIAGLENVTAHQFRHSFATICFEAGITPKAAAAFMGDTEKITQDIYTELRDNKHKTSAEQLNDYVQREKMVW